MRSPAFIMEPRDGKVIQVVGDEVIVKVSSRDTDGAFAVFEGRTQPNSGPPLHLHRDEDEVWRVLEGEYLFEVDGDEIYAGPGATVFAPRGTRHTFQNIGRTPGRLVTTVVPGGLDLFFEEIESLDPAKAVTVFEKCGLELHGPPLAARKVAASAAD